MADRRVPQLPPLPDDETRTLEQAAPRAPPAEPTRRAGRPRTRAAPAAGARATRSSSASSRSRIGLLLNAPASTSRPTTSRTGGSATSRSPSRARSPTSATRCCSTARARASRRSSAARTTTRSTPRSAPARRRRADAAPTDATPRPASPAEGSSRSRRSGSCGSGSPATRSSSRPGFAIVRAAGREPRDRAGRRRRRACRDRAHAPRRLQLVRRDPAEQVKELRPRVVVLGFGGERRQGVHDRAAGGRLDRRLRRLELAPRVRAPGGRPHGHGSTARVRSSSGSASRRRAPPSRRSASTSSTRSSQKRGAEARGPGRLRRHVHDVRRRRRRLRPVPAPTPSGRLVKVRADDGVHFEREGGDMIARDGAQGAEPAVRPHELAHEAHGVTNRGAATTGRG